MVKVLTFKVSIKGLENKIWRNIEITDSKTIADLAYTILSTFDSLAYHLYKITYKDNVYDCWIDAKNSPNYKKLINAVKTKLSSIEFNENDVMEMEYDYGTPTTFEITYLGSKDLARGTGTHYPYVSDGAGRGMIDDISDFELKEIVDDIDKKGYSIHSFTPGYERKIKYDYRDFILKDCNVLLKGIMEKIKEAYETKKR